MEAVWTTIGVIGSIASIYGAYLAIDAEKKAKKHAEVAERAKNQVVAKQRTTELVGILHETKKTQKEFLKYTTAQTQSSLSGVNFEKDAENLREYITRFNENRAIIKDVTELDSDNVYGELQQLLEEFCQDNTLKNKREKGKQIILKIDDIVYKVRKSIDERNESLVE